MSAGGEMVGLVTGVSAIGYGIYDTLRAGRIALRNREQIEIGEDAYFEQRREWEHYGHPPTEAAPIRRFGIYSIIFGIVMILFASPISVFNWE